MTLSTAERTPCAGCGRLTRLPLCTYCALEKRKEEEAKARAADIYVLIDGVRRRAARCHPDRYNRAFGLCEACYQRSKSTPARREKHAAEQRARRLEAAERDGRVPRNVVRKERRPCEACGTNTTNKRWCSMKCKPSPPPARLCCMCEKPTPSRGRGTCSEECRRGYLLTRSTIGLRSESVRRRRRRQERTKYRGKDKAEIIARLTIAQQGRCAACSEQTDLFLDHCHASGRARALLCRRCNVAFGQLLESPERILGLHAYAMRWVQHA